MQGRNLKYKGMEKRRTLGQGGGGQSSLERQGRACTILELSWGLREPMKGFKLVGGFVSQKTRLSKV